MTSEEDDLLPEEIERRHALRGVIAGLSIELSAPRVVTLDAVEGSRQAFFGHFQDPEAFRLGERFDARVCRGGRHVACWLEIVRKEIAPRRGVALRIVSVDPADEPVLAELLGPLATEPVR